MAAFCAEGTGMGVEKFEWTSLNVEMDNTRQTTALVHRLLDVSELQLTHSFRAAKLNPKPKSLNIRKPHAGSAWVASHTIAANGAWTLRC